VITIFFHLSSVLTVFLVDYLLYLISLDCVLFHTFILIIKILLVVIIILLLFIFFEGVLYLIFILLVHFMIQLVLDSLVFFGVKVFHFNIIDDILDILSVQTRSSTGFNELRFIRVAFFIFCYVRRQWFLFAGVEISLCAFMDLRPYLWFIIVGGILFVRIFGQRFRIIWHSICDLSHIRISFFNRLEASDGDIVGVNIFG
jgi:hypothetical protein